MNASTVIPLVICAVVRFVGMPIGYQIIVSTATRSEQLLEIRVELLGDLVPRIDGDLLRRVLREARAQPGIAGETLDQRSVIPIRRQKRVLTVGEEIVRLAVQSQDRFPPTKIFLQLGVAVLI